METTYQMIMEEFQRLYDGYNYKRSINELLERRAKNHRGIYRHFKSSRPNHPGYGALILTADFYQHTEICECKRSFWVINGKCNKCGIPRDRPAEARRPFKAGKPSVGQGWDSKQHKVIHKR